MKLVAHAKARMAERAISADEIYGTVREPLIVRPGQGGRFLYVGAEVVVVVAGKRIVTVHRRHDDLEIY